METFKTFVIPSTFLILLMMQIDIIFASSGLNPTGAASSSITPRPFPFSTEYKQWLDVSTNFIKNIVEHHIDNYIQSAPKKDNFAIIFNRENLGQLSQTSYEFKHFLCPLYTDKLQQSQDIVMLGLETIYSAMGLMFDVYDLSFNDYKCRMMLRTIRRRKPLEFLIYMHEKHPMGISQSSNNIKLLEEITTKFFFYRTIKNTVPPSLLETPKLTGNTFAYGDETQEYDNCIYEVICEDLNLLIGQIHMVRYSNVALKEVQMFPIEDIQRLIHTSRRFKEIFISEYMDALVTNPIINPPKHVQEHNMPYFEEVEVQRRFEAFYALRIACAQMIKFYESRIGCKPQLDELSLRRPLYVIWNVHSAIIRSIRNMDRMEDNVFGPVQLYQAIQEAQNGMWVFTLYIQQPSNNGLIAALFEELPTQPGLGDENVAVDMILYDYICDYILQEFDRIVSQQNIYAPNMRRRIIELKFKPPMRFRAILCQHYLTNLNNNQNVPEPRKKEAAYKSVTLAILMMYDISYMQRIQNLPANNPYVDAGIVNNWKEFDPIYFLFYMHMHNIRIDASRNGINHQVIFINGVQRSKIFQFISEQSQRFRLPEWIPVAAN